MARYLLLLFLFVNLALTADARGPFVDQKIADNRYSVIYVEVERTSSGDAKQYALQHAAELLNQNGYRYFTLDSQQDVVISQSGSSGSPFNGNMYEEKIIERDFGKSSIQRQTAPSPINTYPGLKITVSGYREKPSNGESYDVCQFVKSCRY